MILSQRDRTSSFTHNQLSPYILCFNVKHNSLSIICILSSPALINKRARTHTFTRMHSSTRRLSVALTLFVMISIAMMECSGNPNPEQHEGGNVAVADAIRYLQDLERIARPR